MLQTFTTTTSGRATGPTGIEVPPEVMAGLGPKKNPAVHVGVAGYHHRSTVTLPTELEQALADADVRAAHDALLPSRRKEAVQQVEDVKTADSRQRRVARIVAQLSGS